MRLERWDCAVDMSLLLGRSETPVRLRCHRGPVSSPSEGVRKFGLLLLVLEHTPALPDRVLDAKNLVTFDAAQQRIEDAKLVVVADHAAASRVRVLGTSTSRSVPQSWKSRRDARRCRPRGYALVDDVTPGAPPRQALW